MCQEIIRRAVTAVLTLGISELAAWSKTMREKKERETLAAEMLEAQRLTLERQADLIREQKAMAEAAAATKGNSGSANSAK